MHWHLGNGVLKKKGHKNKLLDKTNGVRMIKIDKNQFHLANQFHFNGIVKKGQRYMTYKSDWMNCKMMT